MMLYVYTCTCMHIHVHACICTVVAGLQSQGTCSCVNTTHILYYTWISHVYTTIVNVSWILYCLCVYRMMLIKNLAKRQSMTARVQPHFQKRLQV